MSPLHCACWKGQTEAVQFLLDNGAQIAETDCSLMTVLHWAVQYGHYDTLNLLLQVIYHLCYERKSQHSLFNMCASQPLRLLAFKSDAELYKLPWCGYLLAL